MLYLRNIYRLETEGAYSLSYMDDFIIMVTLNSAKSNYKKLKGIALELMSRAKEAAISFDISKIELIHFYPLTRRGPTSRWSMREHQTQDYACSI